MLRERQLPAILAESSNPKLFRVLVGPYRSPLALAEAKKKVMDVGGFDGLIPAKY
jgi:cell division septation protein DedD